MKRVLKCIVYISGFFWLAGTIYRVAWTIPPLPGHDEFEFYRVMTVGFAISVATLVLSLAVLAGSSR